MLRVRRPGPSQPRRCPYPHRARTPTTVNHPHREIQFQPELEGIAGEHGSTSRPTAQRRSSAPSRRLRAPGRLHRSRRISVAAIHCHWPIGRSGFHCRVASFLSAPGAPTARRSCQPRWWSKAAGRRASRPMRPCWIGRNHGRWEKSWEVVHGFLFPSQPKRSERIMRREKVHGKLQLLH